MKIFRNAMLAASALGLAAALAACNPQPPPPNNNPAPSGHSAG